MSEIFEEIKKSCKGKDSDLTSVIDDVHSPIVKDANGDISSSKNYRGIAISSLILTIVFSFYLAIFSPMIHCSLDSRRDPQLFNVLGLFKRQFPIILEEDQMSSIACLTSQKHLIKSISINCFTNLEKENFQQFFSD